jgi:hypothetical protein
MKYKLCAACKVRRVQARRYRFCKRCSQEWNAVEYAKRKASGKCVHCCKEDAVPGRVLCAPCEAKAVAQGRKRRGLVVCGECGRARKA